MNLLIALAWPNHIHHSAARRWFTSDRKVFFATCPITEAAFVRLSMNPAVVGESASFQQATHLLDAYLLAVAAGNEGRLVTFDAGIIELIPSGSPFRNHLIVIEV